MERADDCNTTITALCSEGDSPCVSENGSAFIHDWIPVSGNIELFDVVRFFDSVFRDLDHDALLWPASQGTFRNRFAALLANVG